MTFISTSMTKVLNLSLKMAGLVSKLALVLIISRNASNADFGFYGLFSALNIYIVGLIGLEYHASSNREVCRSGGSTSLFTNHVVFAFLVSILSVFISLGVFVFELIPKNLIFYFSFILVFEYISLEIIRYLNMTDRQVQSSLVFSIKTTVWIFPFSLVVLYSSTISMENLYLLWLAFSLLSTVLGLIILRPDIVRWFSSDFVSFQEIKNRIIDSKYIFISSQAVLALYVVDRYVVNFNAGVDIVAIYVFYSLITGALLSILDSTVFVFYLPTLISLFAKKDNKRIFQTIKKMFVNVATICTLFCIAALILIDPLLKFINKSNYLEHKIIFYILLLATVVRLLSLVPHYSLYAIKKDNLMLKLNLLSLAMFLVTFYLLMLLGVSSILAVSLSMLLLNIFHLSIKSSYLLRIM